VGSTEQTKTGNLIVEGVLRLGQFTTANAPSGTEGALYFDTTENTTKLYSNSAWGDLGGEWDGILPNYTTAQRNALSLVDGLIVYNTTENAVQIYASDVWRNVGAKLSSGIVCSLDGDCDSTHCIDGYCCDIGCTGNCQRCNVAGSIGICAEVPSDCTGNCVVCSGGVCTANDSICTGNCDVCSGSDTAYNCAANASVCVCGGGCTGSGTEYNCAPTTVTDTDSNIYNTLRIGTQCWMRENINVGVMLASPSIMPSNNSGIEKWCNGADEQGHYISGDCDIYGGLYTWGEATNPYGNDSGDICPSGWHIPTDAEWCTMTTYLDATVNCSATSYSGTDIGNQLSTLTSGGTNSSGFTALFAGFRYTVASGIFYSRGIEARFWSSTPDSALSWLRMLTAARIDIRRASEDVLRGFSVRCIKD